MGAAAVEAALRRLGVPAGALEASVRREADGGVRGGRGMVERAAAGVAQALAGALGVPAPPVFAALDAAAEALGLPRIAGWDLTGPRVKLYVNASDAAAAVREALGARLGLGGGGAARAPHVVGVNAGPGAAVETKVYQQAAQARALAAGLGAEAEALAAAAEAAGLSAGAVLSFDVSDDGSGLTPRAFFVALRPAPAAVLDAALAGLAGWSLAACAAALPFPAAPPRSVGVALAAPGRWTAYFKPAAAEAPLAALEPAAVFAAGPDEVGVFLAPSDISPRAYARVGGLAVSYRVRRGDPGPAAVEALMGWVVARLQASPTALAAPLPPEAPPAPWTRVGGGRRD